jgi:hypothetical protein
MPVSNAPVSAWSLEDRLGETLRRTLPKLGPETREQFEAIISPKSIAIMAAVLIAWVASHAIGLGEIIDIVLAAVGAVAIGWSVFTGIDHLYDFAVLVIRPTAERDLDIAADHLAKAIAILGVQIVLAVLFRGAKAPKTGKGGRLNVGPAPRTPGARYKPRIRDDPSLPAGRGGTSFWGDIRVSSYGTATERAVVLLHEKVHQFLAPKLYILRSYRVTNRAGSYIRSSLWRFIEESLAETIAQATVQGFREGFRALRFPVKNGYMHLIKGGGFAVDFRGHGAIRELGALLYTGTVMGMAFELRFENGTPPTKEQPQH